MPDRLQPGDPLELGSYRLLGRLGQGGMGTVYLGQDHTGRQVAVKVINPALARNPHFHQRFRREVDAARKVRPFCTAPVIDASLDGDPLYIVTEYIPGPTLDEAVSNAGPLQGSDLAGLAVGVATALAAIHDIGIVHRDLKPSNIVLSGVGPRVIDFGIAKASSQSELTQSGQPIGTPAYRAPELLTGGAVTPASDVYSWGCLIAYAGTGREPDHSTSSVRDLDPEVRPLVEQALSPAPEDRPSVPELLTHLTGRAADSVPLLTPGLPPHQTPPDISEAPASGRPRTSRPLVRAAALGAIAISIALVAWIALPATQSDEPHSRQSPSAAKATPSISQQQSQPTSAPPIDPTPKTDVAPNFIGQWSGVITDYDDDETVTFSAALTINSGYLAGKVGESDYSTPTCHGNLRLVSATASSIVVREQITRGNCTKEVLITLTYKAPHVLTYQYHSAHGRGVGTLRASGAS
ncbi:serine/threonine-protein kinase [Actinomadura violacea]|uniref:Protein kinase n=1 Tax=Actinomadura violacea TaxID=2819934 RepID=A0ABS3RR81_9ACTN|nr:serine/threonine-protein kinase [Actinomadura violacea]MBO2459247.1 protein kinase [Actinomadura violacea]